MSHYPDIGIICFQAEQQAVQGILLLRGTGIGRTSLGIQSAFVADADAVTVETAGMRPLRVERATPVNNAVAGDVEVVADVGIAPGTVVATAVVHGVATGGAGGTAMYHNQVDAAVVLVLAAGQDGVAHGSLLITCLNAEGGRQGGQQGNGDLQDSVPKFFFVHGRLGFS